MPSSASTAQTSKRRVLTQIPEIVRQVAGWLSERSTLLRGAPGAADLLPAVARSEAASQPAQPATAMLLR
jgi:hypothetical protein